MEVSPVGAAADGNENVDVVSSSRSLEGGDDESVDFFVAARASGIVAGASVSEALDIPSQGSGRGGPFRATCDDGSYVVGFDGRVGGWRVTGCLCIVGRW